jgi:perosamine synthetase
MARFIPVAVPHLSGNEKKYVNDCLDTTWISSNGKYIKEFETSFAAWLGTKNALACCNGTLALHLPLLALGIKEGDEVLVPTFTYIATANVVRYCRATPVFVDCLPGTWNIDPVDLEKKITPRTKGVILVHLYGNPCDMDALMAIAQKYRLFVVEDAAECHGAEYHGKKAGTFGIAAIFSFFGNKIITTGEGGMVVTDDDAMAAKMRLFKGQGMDPNHRYWFIETGYNYRMTNIEAAIGLAQLENVDAHIGARRQVADWYSKCIEDVPDYLIPQQQTPGASSVWWMYSIVLTEKSKISRDELMKSLAADGIETRPLFYPMHLMPPYINDQAHCPVAEDITARGINLPTHALLTFKDVEYICARVKKHVIGK